MPLSMFGRRLLHLIWRFLSAVAWRSLWQASLSDACPEPGRRIEQWKAVAPSSTQSSVAKPAYLRLADFQSILPIQARQSPPVDAEVPIFQARRSLGDCQHPPGARTPAWPLVQYSLLLHLALRLS